MTPRLLCGKRWSSEEGRALRPVSELTQATIGASRGRLCFQPRCLRRRLWGRMAPIAATNQANGAGTLRWVHAQRPPRQRLRSSRLPFTRGEGEAVRPCRGNRITSLDLSAINAVALPQSDASALQSYLVRVFVFPQSDKPRMPQMVFRGALDIFELPD